MRNATLGKNNIFRLVWNWCRKSCRLRCQCYGHCGGLM